MISKEAAIDALVRAIEDKGGDCLCLDSHPDRIKLLSLFIKELNSRRIK